MLENIYREEVWIWGGGTYALETYRHGGAAILGGRDMGSIY